MPNISEQPNDGEKSVLPTPPVYRLEALNEAMQTMGESSAEKAVVTAEAQTPDVAMEQELLKTPEAQDPAAQPPVQRQKVISLAEAAEFLAEFQPQVLLNRLSQEELGKIREKISPLHLLAASLREEKPRPLIKKIESFKIPKLVKVNPATEAYVSQRPAGPVLDDHYDALAAKVCFKCRQFGHHYAQCPDPEPKTFCFRCGKQGVTIAFCGRCKGGWNLEGPFVPTLQRNVPHQVHLRPESGLSMSQERRRRRWKRAKKIRAQNREANRAELQQTRSVPYQARQRPARNSRPRYSGRPVEQARQAQQLRPPRRDQWQRPNSTASAQSRPNYVERPGERPQPAQQRQPPSPEAARSSSAAQAPEPLPGPTQEWTQYYEWTLYMAERFSEEAASLQAGGDRPRNKIRDISFLLFLTIVA